ncbi:MAG TPA: hypothetical protein DD658_01720 [Deltaproteobacteria bacterium]|nr:hypothetical protein [Deltaproteobacteria bacterium]
MTTHRSERSSAGRSGKRFRREYPHAAVGKYDVYGLFLERALQILKPGGRLGIVTQDTFLGKEWASSLRKWLASKATVRMVVDLNPFGQLFFRAMNTPAVTVADNGPPSPTPSNSIPPSMSGKRRSGGGKRSTGRPSEKSSPTGLRRGS